MKIKVAACLHKIKTSKCEFNLAYQKKRNSDKIKLDVVWIDWVLCLSVLNSQPMLFWQSMTPINLIITNPQCSLHMIKSNKNLINKIVVAAEQQQKKCIFFPPGN